MLKKACWLILSLVTVLIFGVQGFFQYAHAWASEATPGASLSAPGQEAPEEIKEVSANKAAQVKIITSRLEKELAGQKAPDGTVYLFLTTEWENIHPKEKIEKSRLEKKPDRTRKHRSARPRRSAFARYSSDPNLKHFYLFFQWCLRK